MEGLLKFKLLLDVDLIGTTSQIRLEKALERQLDMVLAATEERVGTEWEIIPHEYKDIGWTRNSVGGVLLYTPKAAWIQRMTDTHLGKADFLQMGIHQDNWKPAPGNIGGLNIFKTQIFKVNPSWGVYSWFVTLEEELMHSFDQIAAEYGYNLNTMFGVRSFDRDVVHGRDPRYTRGRYGHVYKKIQDILVEIYPNDMPKKQLIQFVGDTDVFLQVAAFKLFDVTNSPELLAEYEVAEEDIRILPAVERDNYKKVGVITQIKPTDL